MRLRTRDEALRERIAAHARTGSRRVLDAVADARHAVAMAPCVVWSASLSLGAVALAAHEAYGGRLVVWSCSASIGVLETLPSGTLVVVDESMRRRLRQPEALESCGVEVRYARLHTKGFVCASGAECFVCLSSCNLSRGCGIEHYDLSLDRGLAAAALASLGVI